MAYAKNMESRISLGEGAKLLDLMIEHHVGVSIEAVYSQSELIVIIPQDETG